MERKVFADIELEARHINVHSRQGTSPFLPCEIVSCFYEYPLKILLPDSTADSYCQWIYPVNFGGGLVEGDDVNISIKIGSNCCMLMATLSFPKVYCCKNGFDSQQHMKFDVCSHALLCVLPDPIVCYKKASYIQTQHFYLTPDANVVSLDWFTSGRYERGERWDFSRLKTVSNFYMNNQLVFKEAQQLQNTHHLSLKQSMKSYNVCGTCIIVGPFLSFIFEKILLQLGKFHNYGEKYLADSIFAVSPLFLKGIDKPSGCIVRFASESVSEAIQKIEELLEPLLDIIGDNPLRH